ncbi:MAG: hypothetical protein K1X94_16390 [Sandaracinaceae bacterium]|nr:hypothetical protein [Sandaracinaceae bacterium]
MVEALICPRCGGPLVRPPAIPALVECGFCGTALSLAGAAQVTAMGDIAASLAREERLALARKEFTAALVPLLRAGRDPYDALREAASAHLSGQADPDTLARVAYALVYDFEQSTGAPALGDPVVLGRISEAYLRVFSELRKSGSAELNLPFLTATPAGPVHLQRTVTPALFLELAQRDPRTTPRKAPAPAPAPAPAADPPKKKGWWPF